VIFISHRTDGDSGYGDMVDRMVELASNNYDFWEHNQHVKALVLQSHIGSIWNLLNFGNKKRNITLIEKKVKTSGTQNLKNALK